MKSSPRLGIGLAMLALASTPLAPAQADDGNAAFLDALGKAGVPYSDPNVAADLGRSVCPMLARPGGSFAEAASTVGGSSVPPAMAGLFTSIAISMYCPTMMTQLANGDLSGLQRIPGLSGLSGVPGV